MTAGLRQVVEAAGPGVAKRLGAPADRGGTRPANALGVRHDEATRPKTPPASEGPRRIELPKITGPGLLDTKPSREAPFAAKVAGAIFVCFCLVMVAASAQTGARAPVRIAAVMALVSARVVTRRRSM